ncbi:carbohydrate kinase [Paenibacillus sp. YN15]|uniref:carbohydrate kinase family protein n=1 Tax=Paenibacillus sp. YN15 TaxID=1742774 RepID=UPI000DCC9A0C|nr:carbohydrate kinase [Paenibacillus sp. YN15]RAU97360.1 carbohydrate kinase [Paenibacillus sp. YN15]
MLDAAAVGEVLIDFTPAGTNEYGYQSFSANPGGAPANVMAALAKWGRKAGFIGKVGKDTFGEFLQQVLEQAGVDTRGLVLSEPCRTTLAFVHLQADGDRSFSFYRSPGADMMLTPEEVREEIVAEAGLLHFGSVSLTDEPSAAATLHAIRLARGLGKLVSFDPNLRPALWKSLDEAKARIREGLELAHIVKLSEEELEFLTGEKNLETGTELLCREFRTPLILVTLGAEGSFFRLGGECRRVPGRPVQAVDTTGAGDCYLAGFLHKFLEAGGALEQLDAAAVQSMAAFANAAGALITLSKGAIPAIPQLTDIEAFLAQHG